MPKVLWVGDSPQGKTGFGRITQNVLSQLMAYGWEVANMGVNHHGMPSEFPWHTYPALCGGDQFGFGMTPVAVNDFAADVVVLSSDIWVCRGWYEQMLQRIGPLVNEIPCIIYFPVDGAGYDEPMIRWLNKDTSGGLSLPHPNLWAATYTEFGADVVRKAGYLGNVEVIPLGVDTSVYYPMDKMEARRELGMDTSEMLDFIILNANRNQVRKRHDLTIGGFAKFLKLASRDGVLPPAKLWMHMQKEEAGGWHLGRIWLKELAKAGFDTDDESIRNRLVICQGGGQVPEERMRLLYNAADAGINTCMGEGHGLVTHEHAACARPQIVGNHSAFRELWKGGAHFFHTAEVLYETDLLIERYIGSVDSIAEEIDNAYQESLRGMDYHAKYMGSLATHQRLSWPSIGNQWHNLLTAAMQRSPFKEKMKLTE